jgi:hypothetical protein
MPDAVRDAAGQIANFIAIKQEVSDIVLMETGSPALNR